MKKLNSIAGNFFGADGEYPDGVVVKISSQIEIHKNTRGKFKIVVRATSKRGHGNVIVIRNIPKAKMDKKSISITIEPERRHWPK